MGSNRGLVLSLGWSMATVGGCTPDFVAPAMYGAPEDAGEEAPSASSPLGVVSEAASPDVFQVAPIADGESDVPAPETSATPCDLSGRWLATERQVTAALGTEEATHTFYYLEISQTGSQATVTRGLDCGGNGRPISAIGANTDYPKVWPALLTHDTQTGRTATSAPTSSGCSISFEQRYLVMGATVPYYDDPSHALPMTSQQADGGSPGWEDWDQDGEPGYTVNVTGFITGQVYLASRTGSAWSGTISAGATTFKLADKWTTQQSLLGYSGSSLLTSATSAEPDSDASLHFVQFARLDASQATGGDADACAAVRNLAGTLTPDASN
jgi:hypothetical protein